MPFHDGVLTNLERIAEGIERLAAHQRQAIPYKTYLETVHWKNIRELALEDAKYKCQRCNKTAKPGFPLEVHHRTYVRLWAELREDVEVLCNWCHRDEHGIKRKKGDRI
jgi:5-methylcytosine-specific restriction endonuclease McrA